MSLHCSGECCAHGEKDFAKTVSNLWPEDANDSNRAGAHVIEHFVDGLVDLMRFAAASRAGGAIGCCARKGRF
jgi:hypothetical protein